MQGVSVSASIWKVIPWKIPNRKCRLDSESGCVVFGGDPKNVERQIRNVPVNPDLDT